MRAFELFSTPSRGTSAHKGSTGRLYPVQSDLRSSQPASRRPLRRPLGTQEEGWEGLEALPTSKGTQLYVCSQPLPIS